VVSHISESNPYAPHSDSTNKTIQPRQQFDLPPRRQHANSNSLLRILLRPKPNPRRDHHDQARPSQKKWERGHFLQTSWLLLEQQ
jgi:hypothetical protein